MATRQSAIEFAGARGVLLFLVGIAFLQSLASIVVSSRFFGAAGQICGVAAALCVLVVIDHLAQGIATGTMPHRQQRRFLLVASAGALITCIFAAWGLTAFPAALLFFVFPPRVAIKIAPLILVSGFVAFLPVSGPSEWLSLLLALVISLAFAMSTYVLVRLRLVLRELQLTQEHLARVEVDNERHRISRDLHDILGRSLVAATMRAHTAVRLVERDPSLAKKQLEELANVLTDGQTNLRRLTLGESIIGLRAEVDAATALCERVGIRVVAEVHELDDDVVDQLAARIIREATTNLLKHSRAARVDITVDLIGGRAVVRILNDGATTSSPSTPSGTGLADLRARVEALGGVLQSGPSGPGNYEVVAQIPTAAARADLDEDLRAGPSGDGTTR